MIRKGLLWLHKWLGIVTGTVVFLVSLSGAIYCFHDELKLLFYPEKYFLNQVGGGQQPKPLTELIRSAESYLPQGERVSRVDIYPARNRTWIFRAMATDEAAVGHWNYYRYYKRVFLDPYTGKLAALEDSRTEFFQLVLQLHMNLLLGKTYGHAAVGYSTAVFVILLLTGIVLWWPKNRKRKTLKRSLWIDTKAKWKRLNYDLHNVLGFYSFFVALVLGVTGLVYSFPAFKKAYVGFFNLVAPGTVRDTSDPQVHGRQVPLLFDDTMDNTLHYLLCKHPDAGIMSVRLRGPESPLIDVQVRMEEKRSGTFKWYYVDRSTGRVEQVIDSGRLTGGEKAGSLNFDLHTGSIGGLGTKILACVISLFCASLPITGYILWWNKRKKSVKREGRKKPAGNQQ